MVGNFDNNKDIVVVVFGILGILHIHFQLQVGEWLKVGG